MQYLPARCDACSFVVLVPHHVHGVALQPCAKCGAELSVFPGAKHLARERELFAKLSEAVHATVTPGDAASFLAGVEHVGDDASVWFLSLVGARLPALAKLVADARFSTSNISLAAMLLTMLRARASVRRHSGFIVACGPVAQPDENATPDAIRRSP